MSVRAFLLMGGFAAGLAVTVPLLGQGPPPDGAPGRGGPGGRGGQPAADPAVVARGRALFDASCAGCHGSDLRGGQGGINLVRSQAVLDDKRGDKIGPIANNGHAAGKAPKANWTPEQILDVATFVHALPNYRVASQPIPPEAILTGDARAGQAYFQANCSGCHSVTDASSSAPSLKGIATRINNPKSLQNAWVAGSSGRGGGMGGPSGTRPITVTVTMPNGQKLDGTLNRSDDFLLLMTEANGTTHTIPRNGDVPKVEIHNPRQAHMDMFTKYTDKDIHNVTAYLWTLK